MTTVHILRDNISLSHSAGTTNEIVVVPGECVTAHEGLLRGHGTYVENGDLVASVAGAVQRVNKLVTVRPLNSRYSGEIGDVVIGRISEVGAKRWKVDVNSYQDAVLMLSSVILPGGQQRRRTYEDQLQMRDVFVEGELLSVRYMIYKNNYMSLTYAVSFARRFHVAFGYLFPLQCYHGDTVCNTCLAALVLDQSTPSYFLLHMS